MKVYLGGATMPGNWARLRAVGARRVCVPYCEHRGTPRRSTWWVRVLLGPKARRA